MEGVGDAGAGVEGVDADFGFLAGAELDFAEAVPLVAGVGLIEREGGEDLAGCRRRGRDA